MGENSKRSKKRSAEPTPALDVLQALLEKGNSPLAEDFKRYKLKLNWGKVVGTTIGEKSSPVGYTNGTVYIWVVNSVWMNQLFYLRRDILQKINTHMGAKWARSIRFTLDAREVPKAAAEALGDEKSQSVQVDSKI